MSTDAVTYGPFEQAGDLLTADQPELAADLLRDHLTTHPDDALCWRRLGRALLVAGEASAAMSAAERAVDLIPGDTLAYQVWAAALVSSARYDQALPVARQLVRLDPDDAQRWLALAAAEALGRRHDLRAAVRAVHAALAAEPGSESATQVLAELRVARRNQALGAMMAAGVLPGLTLLVLGALTPMTQAPGAPFVAALGAAMVLAPVVVVGCPPLSRRLGWFPPARLRQVLLAVPGAWAVATGALAALGASPAAAAWYAALPCVLATIAVALSRWAGAPRRGGPAAVRRASRD